MAGLHHKTTILLLKTIILKGMDLLKGMGPPKGMGPLKGMGLLQEVTVATPDMDLLRFNLKP